MALDQSDVCVMLKPVSDWPKQRTKSALIEAMRKRLIQEAPGAAYSFSQPIQMRMQELTESGLRSDIAVKVFGDDLNILKQKADEIAAVLERVQGAEDVRTERVAGLPYLRIRIRRDAIARHALDAGDVLNSVEAMGGKVVGQVLEGNRRFPLQLRFEPEDRDSVEQIRPSWRMRGAPFSKSSRFLPGIRWNGAASSSNCRAPARGLPLRFRLPFS